MEKANILTLTEAKNTLRLDGTFPESQINDYNSSATSFVDGRTGRRWEVGEVDPDAKSCARLVLLQNFYHDADHDFREEIIDWLNILKRKGVSSDGK